MLIFFKELNRKYYIFLSLMLLLLVGQAVANITVNFFFTALWETIFIPSIIITFWDDFMDIFPSTSSEPPKIKKPYMITIIIFVYTVFFNQIMFYYLADIPNAINKTYVSTEGKVSYVAVKQRIRPIQFFEMNERIYFNHASDFIKVEKNEKYRVTILKNSKYVFGIEKINKQLQNK